MADYYICPTCEEKNEEHRKYCKTCGTWLLSTNFPAKKIVKQKKRSAGKGLSGAFVLLVIIGAVWYFFNGGAANPFAQKITFDKVDVGPYSFSQLQITGGVKSFVPVDLHVREDSKDPIEVAAVFYAEDGTRIARASTVIMQQMPAGYTTTLNLKLDEPTNLMTAHSVRMEVKPLTPFELLQRTADALKSQQSRE